MWNEGVIEGLKIANVFIKQKILEDTDNLVLHKLFFDIQNQIDLQLGHIEYQNSKEDIFKSLFRGYKND